MLYCRETAAIREKFHDWLMDYLPIEISAKGSKIWRSTLQEHNSDLIKQFYLGVAQYISETIKTVSYIDTLVSFTENTKTMYYYK